MNLNKRKIVSIVGTRLSTDYGVEVCKQLVKDLVPHDPLIVSGMAYGIDIVAHRAAIENGLQTVGVMAHGLNEVYPSRHQGTALQMMENGGLLSEFKCGTPSMPENFPKRNRIVAGVADLTIVIESSDRGGSLITADLANQYNRDLFAVPGNLHSTQSEGCNWLIKTNKAALLQSVKDIEYVMGWEPKEPKPNKMLQVQGKEEKRIVKTLLTQEKMGIDTIAQRSNIPLSKTSATLLTLELEGVVKAYPGKLYKLL